MTTSTLPIPATPEALTAGWLTEALRDAGTLREARVTEVTREAVGQGVGVLCQLFRLGLTYDRAEPDAPASVVAKMPSGNEMTRQLAGTFQFYEREVRFYDDLASQICIDTPGSLVRRFDPATGDFILLLEDLGAHRLADQIVGATLEEARLIVRSLAEHHAQWWQSPRLEADLAWIPRGDSEVNKAGMMLYPMAIPPFLERFGGELAPGMGSVVERLAPFTNELLERVTAGPQTICHGDWRLDNFFFGKIAGQPPLTVIDWQIAIRTVGTYDLGYFMSQSVDIAFRREHERDLMTLYFDTLARAGVEGYSREQFLDDYRATLLFCLAYPVMGGGLGDLSNERGVALGRAMLERCTAAIQDWDAAALLP